MSPVSGQAGPRTTPLFPAPRWFQFQPPMICKGGQMLNIAVFKSCNNILYLSTNYSLGCYIPVLFFLFSFFFSWAHGFPNSCKITTSILSCPDCLKKSLIALFICSA